MAICTLFESVFLNEPNRLENGKAGILAISHSFVEGDSKWKLSLSRNGLECLQLSDLKSLKSREPKDGKGLS